MNKYIRYSFFSFLKSKNTSVILYCFAHSFKISEESKLIEPKLRKNFKYVRFFFCCNIE